MISLPDGFTNRMKIQLGGGYEDFISCYDRTAFKALRLNRRMILPEDYDRLFTKITGREEFDAVGFWCGAYYYTDDGPGKSALHEAGAFYIQEPSAMLPATMLKLDDTGLKVLDLCAAPGGKTTQIADCMNGRGLLVANEIISSRAAILSQNVERMGVTNALVLNSDPEQLEDRFPAYFDRILVDAPCSGEGMFRKNPEAAGEWSVENVNMCAERQKMLLSRAVAMLAPDGIIVYSTCTFSTEEDEEVVEYFLKNHPDFTICDGPHKLYPHTFNGEGHFAVAFARGDLNNSESHPYNGTSRDLPRDKYACASDFFSENFADGSRIRNLTENNKERLISFGDSLYLAPEFMPDISGLKVLRAGLKLGTFKKNRFEPDHALSHAVTPADVNDFVDLEPDSLQAKQYLSGMTLSCDSKMKGWCLVCTMGLSLGWGKAGGGILKNHYPRGLRRMTG